MGVKIRHRETGEERTLLNPEYTAFVEGNRDEVAEFWQVIETDAVLPYENSEKYMQELQQKIDALVRRNGILSANIDKHRREIDVLCQEIVESVFPPIWGCRFPSDHAATAMVKAAITIRTRSGGTLDNAIKSAFDILGGETENRYDGGDDEDDD